MDILFYGEKEKQFCFSSYAQANNLKCECKNIVTFNISTATHDILAAEPKELIIDADCIIDNGDCATQLAMISDAIGCKIIMVAIGYDIQKSTLLKKFIVAGINNYITAPVLGNAREEYAAIHEERNLTDEAAMLQIKKDAAAKEILSNKVNMSEENKLMTIGVCGCIGRIGTTTLALQLAKHLSLKGRKVAYLERNNSGFIAATKEAYKCEEDEALGKISFDGLDMFYDLSLIKRIMAEGYDCLVYDYGVSTNENIVSLLEQEKIFICCGLKNKELTGTYEVLRRFLHSEGDINYCFNFVHPSLYNQTLEMMGKKREHTMFLGYTPEMLILENENNDGFEKLFAENSQDSQERKKFKWNLKIRR